MRIHCEPPLAVRGCCVGRTAVPQFIHASVAKQQPSVADLHSAHRPPPPRFIGQYLPRDYHTKAPRGFAFVEMVDERDAEVAQRELNGVRLDGR
jgi:hypothetical protein